MNRRLSESRRTSKNPYSFMEELEEGHAEEEAKLFQSASKARAEPKADYPGVLHNPYHAANNEGLDSGEPQGEHSASRIKDEFPELQISADKPRQYSRKQIQGEVKRLHRLIWGKKEKIWGDKVPENPVEMLDVRVAAKLAGFEFQELSGIGVHQTVAGDAEVAGLIDPENKTISISRQLNPKSRRFTAAHEIGHAVLHDLRGSLHRDRSDEILKPKRDRVEKEADEFATLFLMPAKLVEARFLEAFYNKPFTVTNQTAFALGFTNVKELLRKHPTRRELAKLLASTERFNFINRQSLADQFGVSVVAMAIRLEELGLIE